MSNFKRIISTLLLIIAFLSFTGCQNQEAKIKKADEFFDNGDYYAALEIYQECEADENVNEKISNCQKEIGMQEKADNAFLSELEKSILGRMNNSGNSEYENLVNTELAYVESFSDKEFYDESLKSLAQKYIDALYVQKESLNNEVIFERQINWQRGMVYRYEVLNELHRDYGFLKGNKEFEGTYIYGLEQEKEKLNAYNTIEADIESQEIDTKWVLNNYSVSCVVKNNTKYTYSTAFEAKFLNKEGAILYADQCVIENITPSQSYTVSFYVDSAYAVDGFEWLNYYLDIK